MKESDLQRQCNAVLRKAGIRFLHMGAKSREQAGWPDLVFAMNGRPIAVELKAKGGRISPDQAECLDAMTRNGWQCHVCFSLDQFSAIVLGAGVVTPDETKWPTGRKGG